MKLLCFIDPSPETAMHLEPYVPPYLWQPGSVEDMVHTVYYASAGAEFVFSGGPELNLYVANIEKMVVAGRQDCHLPVVLLSSSGSIVVGKVKCVLMLFDMIMEFNFVLRLMVQDFDQSCCMMLILYYFYDTFEGSKENIKNTDLFAENIFPFLHNSYNFIVLSSCTISL